MGMKSIKIPPGVLVPVLLVWIFYSHPPTIFGNLPIKYHDALQEWENPVHSGTDALVNSRALPKNTGTFFLKVEGVMISSTPLPKKGPHLDLEKLLLCFFAISWTV